MPSRRLDFQGAIVYATSKYLERDAKVTQLNRTINYGVGGHQISLTNRDGSRTMAGIYLHAQMLHIVEGTSPEGAPGPELFEQSFGWIDGDGRNIRYETRYHHAFPPPTRGFGRPEEPGR